MTFGPNVFGKRDRHTDMDEPIKCSSLTLQREEHQRRRAKRAYKAMMPILLSNDESPNYTEFFVESMPRQMRSVVEAQRF
jgi:hypothetical protein